LEHLFSPCSRLFDYIENQDVHGDILDDFEMIKELNLDVSTQELLSAERSFKYADLYAMLGDGYTVAWLTPNMLIMRTHGSAKTFSNQLVQDGYCSCHFIADGKEVVATARSSDSSEICDVVLRLMAVSGIRSILINSVTEEEVFINADSLEYLMEECQSLKLLSFYNIGSLNSDHCRVLGAYSRPDLEIVLDHCAFTSAGTSALVEILGRNQGPTKIDCCIIDNSVLADGLRGNSRLKSLIPRISSNPVLGNREILAYTHALSENRGLVDLKIDYFLMKDETWGAVCDSLKTHPTLQVLDLRAFEPPVPPATITARIPALLGMLKVNNSIHTIHLHSRYSEHELFQGSVTPYLETNRLRPRVRDIQKTLPIAYRAKVLGRALLALRTDPNRFWMLLSGNA
jgi:hypothetical protein